MKLRAAKASHSSINNALTRRIQLRSKSSNNNGLTKSLGNMSSFSSLLLTTALDHDNINNRRREKHQLVVSSSLSSPSSQNDNYYIQPAVNIAGKNEEEEEQGRIAAMRIFLLSLQLGTANFTLSTMATKLKAITSTKTNINIDILEGNMRHDVERKGRSEHQEKEQNQLYQQQKLKPRVQGSKLLTLMKNDNSDITDNIHLKNNDRRDDCDKKKEYIEHSKLRSDLRRYIYDQDILKSMILFKKSQKIKIDLPRNTIADLFFMVSQKDSILAYQIIQYYNTHHRHQNDTKNKKNDNKLAGDPALDSATKKRLSLYKRMVSCVSLLNPHHHKTRQMHIMVDSLLNEIKEMDMESKQMLYPNLVVALVQQRSNTIGQYATQIYNYMIENNFDIKPGFLTRIISTSKYNRQDDVPFYDVISRLVDVGGQLSPDSILPAIQNMFPYTNTEHMSITLEAWLKDFRIKGSKQREGDGKDTIWWNQGEVIDLSTLEMISTSAAGNGCSKLILLVWDVLEVCHYLPTETIYENTIVTFANGRNGGLRKAFVAMSSMKEDGFVPSRPLIRSFSTAIRLNKSLIGMGRRLIIDDKKQEMLFMENDKLLSLESLNVIMSAYAERGDPRDVANILDVMIENNIKPNADSYSFVIEALGRDIKKRLKRDDDSYKQGNVEIADTILTMMEEDGTAPTTYVIQHYIELLCLAGEIETATSVVEDFLSSSSSKNEKIIVNNTTIYRVAMENAISGNYEIAKKIALMTSEFIPALHRKIASQEQRSSYMKDIKHK